MTTAWTNRNNADSGMWEIRGEGTGTVSVGGGSSSFCVGPMTNFIFWSPRILNFGTIIGGLDQWTNRTHGSGGWSVR
jgi:hypothetical protein